MKSYHKIPITVFLSFIVLLVPAQIRLPQLISDGMVLQRETPAKIRGWASPGETIRLNFKNTDYQTSADATGQWEIQLPPQKAGGPYTIQINTTEIKNILFGDVWLCSGQSNMETPVSRVMTLFGKEIENYSNPNIHYVKIPLTYNFHEPQDDVSPCSWVELNPETAADFSAVAYFFAKELYEKTGVPIGLINSSVGGSPAEAWISEEALKPFPALLNDMRLCQSDEFVAEMLRLGSLPGSRWYTILNEQDKGLNETIKWYSPQYDDRSWPSADLFDNRWGKAESHPINGVFWFRKTIEVPQAYENQPAMLYMGRIVDADSIFVNGKCVGTTGYQYPPRNYPVPANILKAGNNQITVRLVSQAGFPEFVSGKPYQLVFPDLKISLEGEWKYNTGALMPPIPGGGITFQYKPAGLYNAMIAPLKNHALKGIIWYQGESNTDRYYEYYDLMATLISDWRNLWEENLPFIGVQLANFMKPALLQQQSNWAELRDVQRKLYQTVPNTGMAVAIDIGEWNDIHPLNKKEVGKRLALQARSLAYGEKMGCDGPVYQSSITDGNRVILSFKAGTDDLLPVDELKGFAVAGSDGIFKPAQASIDGKRVIVRSDEIAQPVKVRYAWADNPEGANLYNRAGLPASPFQTDLP
ncbi:MAG: beta galactosidase jelly roll domain-containing protein [Candidatus Azobacteroides sp.]|nr:beta galactosidase jelly roll domain-containing protein [Candidatus Azobacteroides sp.]